MSTFGYVRVSTLQQANEGDSLETQLRQIKSYSELKGYNIPTENLITEKGVSGTHGVTMSHSTVATFFKCI